MYKKYMRSSFKGKKVAMIEDMQIKFWMNSGNKWILDVNHFYLIGDFIVILFDKE